MSGGPHIARIFIYRWMSGHDFTATTATPASAANLRIRP
ncbi:MAG: hypothetical protein QOI69_2574, partial [Pseudonocardiales bacterium]|nr:hypothetical protein [Pseudonocardiales bacterium]